MRADYADDEIVVSAQENCTGVRKLIAHRARRIVTDNLLRPTVQGVADIASDRLFVGVYLCLRAVKSEMRDDPGCKRIMFVALKGRRRRAGKPAARSVIPLIVSSSSHRIVNCRG